MPAIQLANSSSRFSTEIILIIILSVCQMVYSARSISRGVADVYMHRLRRPDAAREIKKLAGYIFHAITCLCTSDIAGLILVNCVLSAP